MDARDHHALVLLFIVLSVFPYGVLTGCQFPAALQGRWLRARDNQPLDIASPDVTGHNISQGATVISTFNCNVTSESQYLLAAPSSLQTSGGSYLWIFFCWEFTRVTNITYLLYELTPIDSDYDIRFVNETQATITRACTLSKINEEPTILYKLSSSTATTVAVNTIPQATLPCPSDVFANYSYVADSASCSGKLDFCVDRSTARATVGTCPISIYSAGGVLSCLTDFTISSVKYIMLINQDSTVTNTGSSYRFVCMKLTSISQVTVYPKICSGTAKHDLALTTTASCPITTTTTPGPTTTTSTTTTTTTPSTTTSTTTTTTTTTLPTQSVATSTSSSAGGDGGGGGGLAVAGIAAGTSIGLVALAAIVVVAVVLLYQRARRLRAVTPDKPPTTNGNSHPVTNHSDVEQPPTTAPDQTDPPSPIKPARLPPLTSDATPRTEALRS